MKRPDIVAAIRETLLKVAPEASVILYGSEARGDATLDSDIDLLILLNKEKITLKEQQAITYPLYDVAVEKGVLINPIVLSRKIWESTKKISFFYKNVMREGVVLC